MEKIFLKLMEFHTNLKLFHFQTQEYAKHKASDELYSSLVILIDNFLETYQGKLGKRIPKIHGSISINSMSEKQMIHYCKHFVKNYLTYG